MNHPNPEVTIGIPSLNGPDRLERCLRSIQLYTPWGKAEREERITVLVVDDFSTPENLKLNKDVCSKFGVDLLMHEQRRGVAQGWNHLTRHTKAEWIILMNDDVEVVPDWYEALMFSLKRNPYAGMIGLPAYQGVNSLNFIPPPRKSYNEAKMQRGHGMFSTTGFLFGFERKKYDEIGGFDNDFFLFYEELDFSVRLLKKGYLPYMLSYPIVIHQGGASTSDTRNVADTHAVMADSRAKFKAKHGSIEQVRREMGNKEYAAPIEWNTMLKTWVD